MYVPNFTSTKIQGYKAKILKENASLSFFPNQTCSQLLHIFKSAKVVLSSRKLTYCLMLPFIAQHLPTMPYTSIAQ